MMRPDKTFTPKTTNNNNRKRADAKIDPFFVDCVNAGYLTLLKLLEAWRHSLAQEIISLSSLN